MSNAKDSPWVPSNDPALGPAASPRVDMEAVVIGSVLLTGKVPATLRLEDFANEKYRVVFRVIKAIEQCHQVIDQVTVANELGGHLQQIGGLDALDALAKGLPVEPHVGEYLAILRDKARRRRVAAISDALQRASESTENLDVLIAQATAAFGEVLAANDAELDFIETLPDIQSFELQLSWIVDGLLAERTVNLITGESGDGKSTLAFHLGACVAAGRPFLGRATIQQPVLYVDLENPLSAVKDRAFRLGIRPMPALRIWGSWNERAPEGPGSALIRRYVERYRPLVIFDSKRAFDHGDEQDASATRQHMDLYRRLANLGGTVGLLHNTGKAETSKEYRGSSDIKAAVDAAYLLERTDGSTSSDALGGLRLKPFKNRIQPTQPIRFDYANGKFLVTDTAPRSPDEIMEDLIRLNPGSTQSELEKLAQSQGIGKNRVPALLLAGQARGRFQVWEGKKGARRWQVREPDLV